jgi:hypothetical protein
MNKNRLLLPGIFLCLLVIWAGWQIYSGWGLVTLDFRNAPLTKVLSSISRQGGIRIESNLDPATPVSIKVRRVPPLEALDIVAVRTEASWRLVYLGAPAKEPIEAVIADFRKGGETSGWTAYGGGGMGMMDWAGDAVLDFRRVRWNPSGTGDLREMLDEVSQKTGVMVAVPSDWNPAVRAPKPGALADAARALFKNAGGVSQEVFLLRRQLRRDDGAETGEVAQGGSWIGRSSMRPQPGQEQTPRRSVAPEIIAERMEAQIALLPMAEQEQSRAYYQANRHFWQEIRSLPEDQRRNKIDEMMSRPEVVERMEDRRIAREAKMTPEQRINRSKRYWDRKMAAKKPTEEGR